MLRRRFLQTVALSSVGTFHSLRSIAAVGSRTTLILEVKGFTCPTCPVGLDTLLGKEKGVLSSHSRYPEGKVTVVFDAQQCSEQRIRAFITDMGFTVARILKHSTS